VRHAHATENASATYITRSIALSSPLANCSDAIRPISIPANSMKM